jgi:signal transduction histidine kinase
MEDTAHASGRLGRLTSLSLSLILIISITVLHYVTPTALPLRHEIYYRLYYIPIIISAFSLGLAGGIGSALLISVLVFPHILIDWGGLVLKNLSMLTEILLYNIVGILTGVLVSRERRRRAELEKTTQRLEESLRELEEHGEKLMEIEQSLRAHEKLALMGEMAAVMAHEVRNPLGSIQGAAELLSDKAGDDDEAKRYASILTAEVRRIGNVVTDLIASARRESGKKSPVEVNRMLGDMASLYSHSARKKKVRVIERHAVGLPPVLGNEDRLRQVFINIFLNAVEAVNTGGEVTVSTEKVPSGVLVSVKDNGPGISREEREKVFDLFHTTKEGGTGIGLAISRRIVEEHGGKIEIRSEEGKGTEVLITLPPRENGEGK